MQCFLPVVPPVADIHYNTAVVEYFAVAGFGLVAYIVLRMESIDWTENTLATATNNNQIKRIKKSLVKIS